MDAKELQTKINAGEVNVGDKLWVADYRHNNVTEKPIRHVEPQLVELCANDTLPKNKTIYYADFHFRPVSKTGTVLKQVIAPYDNTGYRGYTGVSVGIFFTEQEAKDYYVKQCNIVLDAVTVERDKQDKLFANLVTENVNRIANFS